MSRCHIWVEFEQVFIDRFGKIICIYSVSTGLAGTVGLNNTVNSRALVDRKGQIECVRAKLKAERGQVLQEMRTLERIFSRAESSLLFC